MPDETIGSKLQDAMLKVAQNEHSYIVLRAVGMLEYDLQRCLCAAMPGLNSKLRDKLFTGYGPLAGFSAKIDICFGLDIYDMETHEELHKIRSIRNKIAHIRGRISLDIEPVLTVFNSLRRYVGGSYADVFVDCVYRVDDKLEGYLVSRGVLSDIRAKNLPATHESNEAAASTPPPPPGETA